MTPAVTETSRSDLWTHTHTHGHARTQKDDKITRGAKLGAHWHIWDYMSKDKQMDPWTHTHPHTHALTDQGAGKCFMMKSIAHKLQRPLQLQPKHTTRLKVGFRLRTARPGTTPKTESRAAILGYTVAHAQVASEIDGVKEGPGELQNISHPLFK